MAKAKQKHFGTGIASTDLRNCCCVVRDVVWKNGVQEVFGAQAHAVGGLSIIFSLGLFLSYFGRRKS
jgi:hypothetical protein